MVKMVQGASDSQGSSMSDISSSRVSAYHTSLTALAAFSGEDHLKGKAYDSAKQFAGSVLVPLLQGGILLSEEISRATKSLPEEYRSRVSSEDLDSEVLEAQIQSYDASIAQTQSLIRSELSKDSLEASDLIYLQKLYHRQVQARNKLQEKLDKLLAFDGYSPSLFNSISVLEGAVNDGLAVVTGSFSGFSGSFSLPSNMGWAKTIGPLEGMTIGATIGSAIPVVGTGVGAAVGAALGTINTVAQLINPNLYSDAKALAYKGIDWVDKTAQDVTKAASQKIQEAGKAINQGVDTLKKGASDLFGKAGKAISSVKLPSFGW